MKLGVDNQDEFSRAIKRLIQMIETGQIPRDFIKSLGESTLIKKIFELITKSTERVTSVSEEQLDKLGKILALQLQRKTDQKVISELWKDTLNYLDNLKDSVSSLELFLEENSKNLSKEEQERYAKELESLKKELKDSNASGIQILLKQGFEKYLEYMRESTGDTNMTAKKALKIAEKNLLDIGKNLKESPEITKLLFEKYIVPQMKIHTYAGSDNQKDLLKFAAGATGRSEEELKFAFSKLEDTSSEFLRGVSKEVQELIKNFGDNQEELNKRLTPLMKSMGEFIELSSNSLKDRANIERLDRERYELQRETGDPAAIKTGFMDFLKGFASPFLKVKAAITGKGEDYEKAYGARNTLRLKEIETEKREARERLQNNAEKLRNLTSGSGVTPPSPGEKIGPVSPEDLLKILAGAKAEGKGETPSFQQPPPPPPPPPEKSGVTTPKGSFTNVILVDSRKKAWENLINVFKPEIAKFLSRGKEEKRRDGITKPEDAVKSEGLSGNADQITISIADIYANTVILSGEGMIPLGSPGGGEDEFFSPNPKVGDLAKVTGGAGFAYVGSILLEIKDLLAGGSGGGGPEKTGAKKLKPELDLSGMPSESQGAKAGGGFKVFVELLAMGLETLGDPERKKKIWDGIKILAALAAILSLSMLVFALIGGINPTVLGGIAVYTVAMYFLSEAVINLGKVDKSKLILGVVVITILSVILGLSLFVFSLLGEINPSILVAIGLFTLAIAGLAFTAVLVGGFAMTPLFWVGLGAIAAVAGVLLLAIGGLVSILSDVPPQAVEGANAVSQILTAIISVDIGKLGKTSSELEKISSSIKILSESLIVLGLLGTYNIDEVVEKVLKPFFNLDGNKVKASAEGIEYLGKSLQRFSSSLVSTTNASILESLGSIFGGGVTEKIEEFAKLKDKGITEVAEALEKLANSLKKLADSKMIKTAGENLVEFGAKAKLLKGDLSGITSPTGSMQTAITIAQNPNSILIPAGSSSSAAPRPLSITQPMNDFIIRDSGQVIPISSEDQVLGFKSGGPIDRVLSSSASNLVENSSAHRESAHSSRMNYISNQISSGASSQTTDLGQIRSVLLEQKRLLERILAELGKKMSVEIPPPPITVRKIRSSVWKGDIVT